MKQRSYYKRVRIGALIVVFAFLQVTSIISQKAYADPVSDAQSPVLLPSLKDGEHRNVITFGLGVTDEHPSTASIEVLSADEKSLPDRIFSESTDGGVNALLVWRTSDEHDGNYKVRYEASDVYGNITKEVYDFKVNNMQPLVTLNDKADDRMIGGTVSRPDVIFQVKFNGEVHALSPAIATVPDENGTYIWTLQVPAEIIDNTYTVEVGATSTTTQQSSAFVSRSLTLKTPLKVVEPVKDDTLIPVVSITDFAQEIGQFVAPSLPTTPQTQLYGVSTTDITANTSSESSTLPAMRDISTVLSSSDVQPSVRRDTLPIASTETGWQLFGIAWYWWVGAGLAVAVAGTAAARLLKPSEQKRRFVGAESI